MNFGSFWHGIYQAPMNSAATKAASSSYNVAYDPSGTHAIEGAYMYKHGSYYYLFYSAGKCCGFDTSRPASGEEYKMPIYIANERIRMCFTPCQCTFALIVFVLGGQIRSCLHKWRRYSCAGKPRQHLRARGTVGFSLLVQNFLRYVAYFV